MLEYLEEPWRSEETWCHSDSSEKPQVKTGWKIHEEWNKPRIRPREWDAQSSLGFWDTNRSHNLGWTTWPCDCQQQKENLSKSGLYHPGRPRSKNKWKWKERWVHRACQRTKNKQWNMKVTVIPVVIGTLGTIPKSLVNGLADLKNQRASGDHPNYSIINIREESRRLEETCCH